MHIIHPDDILIVNRQRREFDEAKLAALSESIQRNTLLHPPVVRKMSDGTFQLVAGERRLRAIKMLTELDIPITHGDTAYVGGQIPVTLISELSEVDAYEVELEENVQREDLTWQERASATARLHALRKAQAESRGEKYVVRQTASEILGAPAAGSQLSKVVEDLTIAQNLSDPEVAKAPSKKEALKVIEKKARQEHRAKLAEMFDPTKSPHTIRHGDAFEQLPLLESESIDLLLTDPPYGVDASNFGSNFSVEHQYEDGWEYFQKISELLATEAMRVLKPNTHAYVFCSIDGWSVLKQDFIMAGFRVWPWPMIWDKGNGNAPWVTKGHKHTYECILFATKGDRDVTTVKSDVIKCPPVSDREHGAEKPIALLVDLIERSTTPGSTILDPFAGSGSAMAAAELAKCSAVVFERELTSFNLLVSKLGEALL